MKFETENAKYILNNGFHQKKSKIDDNTLESIDALVFEMGHYGDWSLSDLLDFKQYSEVVQKNIELDEPKPIFFVDVPRAKFFDITGHLRNCCGFVGCRY